MRLKLINSINNSWQNSTSDIAFLLMIFFILTTTWGMPHILQLGGSGGEEKVKPADLVKIHYDGINIKYNDEIISQSLLEKSLDMKKKYKIFIEDNVGYGKMIEMLSIFGQANITTVEIVTDENQ